MNTFDIGFVPEGWERGQELLIRNGWPVGTISQDPSELSFVLGDEKVNERHVGYVTFNRQDAAEVARVNAWLAWWRED